MTVKRLGPYRIEALLGEGGMGRAYRAVHEPLDREVALKVLHARALATDDARARFQREIHIAATLSHPGIVKVYDGGELDGVDYLAMELVEGPTIDRAIEAVDRVSWTWTLALGASLAEALGYLHAHSIVHRDVKHNNVKLTPAGDVKLLDFGLARAIDSTRLTGEDEWVGTYRYIAPEVVTGDPATPAGDLWSLGVMMHELLTGEPFLGAPSLRDFVQKLIHEPLPALSEVAPHVPGEVSAAVMRLLEKDPTRRPARAADVAREFADLLDKLARGTPVEWLRSGLTRVPPAKIVTEKPRARTAPPRPPSAARARARRGLIFAALSAGALFALLIAMLAPRNPASVTVVQVSGASVASPESDPPAPAGPEPLLARWHLVRDQVDRLRAATAPPAALLQELRRACGLDLGVHQQDWLDWLELGRWLEARKPGPPPLPSRASRGVQENTDRTLELLALVMTDRRPHAGPSATLAISALRLVMRFPDDGRGWLLLGHELAVEGLHAEAARCFPVGLARLAPEHLESSTEVLWCAVGRACAASSDPVGEWLKWFKAGTNENKAWRGLRAGIEARDPDLYVRMLMGGVKDPRAAETAFQYLAKHYLATRRDPTRAAEILARGVKALPGSGELIDGLVDYHLTRGDLPGAAAWLTTPFARGRWQVMMSRLRDESTGGPCEADTNVDWRQQLSVATGLLQRGCVDEAAKVAEKIESEDDEHHESRLPLVFELLASGCTAAWLEPEAHRYLIEVHPRSESWADAAGALAAPAGRPYMEKLLAEAALKWARSWKPAFAGALWLSRAGRWRESLDIFEKVEISMRDRPLERMTEIQSRPVWAAALGDDSAKQVLPRVLGRGAPGVGPVSEYWDKLRVGDLEAAARTALREFLIDPEDPLWVLSLYSFTALPSCPADLKPWHARLKYAMRVNTGAPWLLRQARAIDQSSSSSASPHSFNLR